MNLNPDSPEITAFALGELPAAEREAVAAVVAADPVLQAEVEAIRSCAARLAEQLSLEPVSSLTAAQRLAIAAAAEPSVEPASRGRATDARAGTGAWWRWLLQPAWGMGLAGAAALCLALVIWPRIERDADREFSETRYGPIPTVTNAPAVFVAPSAPVAVSSARVVSVPVAADAPAPAPVAPAAAARRETPVRSQPAPASRPASSPVPAPVPSTAREKAPASTGKRGPRGDALNPSLPSPGVPVQRGVDRIAPPASAPAAVAAESRAVDAMEPTLMNRYGLAPAPQVKSLPPAGGDLAGRSPLGGIAFSGGAGDLGRGRIGVLHRGETYQPIVENPFRPVAEARLSTFGIDVDTASYSNIRRFLREGSLPPANAVRLEEMINYFRYAYPPVSGEHPVAAQVEVAESPWTPGNRLVRVALKARDIPRRERPAANLVFLVDVSGSMEPENKLPLVQRSLRLLTEKLTVRDHVAIVTYAGNAGLALAPANGAEKEPILAAINALRAGGSTHGSAGIRLAYELARTNLVRDGVNRVILCTDGDFNVGTTSQEDLLQLIEGEAKSGVFLTVLGYGMGNYQDATTELLADRGNGSYAYIDSFREAQKVLSEELESTLVTVAKDVKLQIEFNPSQVVSWRLLGYENRVLANRDFNDDTKDAGDLGAGHAVTALYEIVPVGGNETGVDPLRYAVRAPEPENARVRPEEMLFLKLRYKLPDGDKSRLMEVAVKGDSKPWDQVGADFRFTTAVAGFGMLLRDSPHKGNLTFESVLQLAERGLGDDREGYRAEFVDLVRRARQLRAGR